MTVSTGNDPKVTLADVLGDVAKHKGLDTSGGIPEYTEVPAEIAAALVSLGLMQPEPEGG